MDPPSLETISKYIFQPLRAPPPPPTPKRLSRIEANATISLDTKQDNIVEDEQGPLSLESLLQHDKHGSPLEYLPKPVPKLVSTKNSDGSVTTNTMAPPRASVAVERSRRDIFHEMPGPDSTCYYQAHADCVCHGYPLIDMLDMPQPINFDPDMMDMCVNFQLSKRYPLSQTKEHRTCPCAISELSPETHKPAAKSKSVKTGLSKASTLQSPSAASQANFVKTFAHDQSSSCIDSLNPTVIVPKPVQSLFFNPVIANNIEIRPGYCESYPKEDMISWTTHLKPLGEFGVGSYPSLPTPIQQTLPRPWEYHLR